MPDLLAPEVLGVGSGPVGSKASWGWGRCGGRVRVASGGLETSLVQDWLGVNVLGVGSGPVGSKTSWGRGRCRQEGGWQVEVSRPNWCGNGWPRKSWGRGLGLLV